MQSDDENMTVVGIKHDTGKPDYSRIPAVALLDIVRVFDYGAGKYGANNWHGLEPKRLYSAIMRHLEAWRMGSMLDDESGQQHLAHAAASAMMLLHIERQNHVAE